MKKGIIAIVALAAFVVAGMAATAALAQKTKSGEVDDVIKIADPTFKKMRKSAVTFTHKKHSMDYKLSCDSCHHVYKDGKNVWKEGDKVAKCSTCHTDPGRKKGANPPTLYNAFHDNCKDCHKEAKKGPTKCNECHPK